MLDAASLLAMPLLDTGASDTRGKDRPVSPWPMALDCSCRLRSLGLPCSTDGIDQRPGHAGLFSRHHIRTGQMLVRAGDPFRRIHAVRSGTFKSVVMSADGRQQVCGFLFSGELAGLDGIWEGRHQTSVVALEDSHTCAFGYLPLMGIAGAASGLRHGLHLRMSRELARARSHVVVLAHLKAQQRVATFLLDISDRAALRGDSGSEFRLNMTRADIGSYLGMSFETVTRVLSGFRLLGHLDVESRRIRIIDMNGLRGSVTADTR